MGRICRPFPSNLNSVRLLVAEGPGAAGGVRHLHRGGRQAHRGPHGDPPLVPAERREGNFI